MFKTVAEALGEIEAAANAPPKKVERSAAKETTCVDRALTKHSTKCPDCDGRVEFEERSVDKSKMTVYGRSGVRQVLHATYRCVEKHCRTGLYHGYRIMKGGSKVFESYCLDPSQVFLVVSRKTAFDIDFLYEMTLKIYRHNATLEGLSEEFNDFFCDGNKICFFCVKLSRICFLDYDSVNEERLKVDPQRLADGWYTYSFLELSQRYLQGFFQFVIERFLENIVIKLNL